MQDSSYSIYASVDADVYSILRIHNYLCTAQSITYKNHTHPPIEPSNIVHKFLPSCSPKEHSSLEVTAYKQV